MLPKVVQETEVQMFKFWFNDALQDGMHFDNELFYRALVVDAAKRTRLYHLGCKLTDKGGNTIITVTDQDSSLWISLRSQVLISSIVKNPVNGLPHLKLPHLKL